MMDPKFPDLPQFNFTENLMILNIFEILKNSKFKP